jgi:predicted enzyme related to lactoylglutathione lyase
MVGGLSAYLKLFAPFPPVFCKSLYFETHKIFLPAGIRDISARLFVPFYHVGTSASQYRLSMLAEHPSHGRRARYIESLPRQLLDHSNASTSASTFYKSVFKWSVKPYANCPSTELQLFDFRPSLQLSGGIQLAPDKETGTIKPARGGVCVHWLVEDVNEIAKVIEQSGGKVLTDVTKEGNHGLYRYFEDTEGNLGSVYQYLGATTQPEA